jgi:hypothetical protein
MIHKLFLTFGFMFLITLGWMMICGGRDLSKYAEIITKIDHVFMWIFFISFTGFVITGILNIWV